MRFRTRFNAVGGISDFIEQWRRPTPYRWPILAASFLVSGSLMFWVTQEKYYYPPEQPEVTYITTFAEGRTDEEIRQSNIENQRLKDEREAEQARLLERRRELYKEVGAATGLDVDAMEAQIEAEEAEEAAAERERLERLFGEREDRSDTTVETDSE
ncbi:hypothetical protein [Qipengyuania aquimaris]|uniref:hypothetical protein n=1 Tax=Qipengyuania aquimaris TaxID=255984 RepID=UPI001FD3775A|nr:hypothetical protein [Qipengyuania aquimaris]UOR16707.1 hypothetical protein LCM05_06580 [Qipengyuania aquimaris]